MITILFRYLLIFFVSFIANINADEEVIYKVKVKLDLTRFAPEDIAKSYAFRKALVKVSGNSKYGNSVSATKARSMANRYIHQLSQVGIPSTKSSEFSNPTDPGLLVGFHRHLLIDYAKKNKLPIWSSNRSNIVILPMLQQWNGDYRIMNKYSDRNFLNMLRFAVEGRGLALDILALDLDPNSQLQQLNVSQLWDLNVGLLKGYQKSNTVVAIMRFVIAQDAKTLGSSIWQLEDGKQTVLNYNATNIQLAINNIVDDFVDSYSKKFTFVSSLNSQKQAEIVLVNIEKFGDYKKITKKISSLEMINNISASSLIKNRNNNLELSLNISYDSSEQVLLDHILRFKNFELVDIQVGNPISASSDISKQHFRYYFSYAN